VNIPSVVKRTFWAIVGACAIWTTSLTPARAASANDCDRACLKQISDQYFEAMAQHNPSLLPLSPDVKYTETGKVIKLGDGLWRKAGKPTYRLELFDPETGGIAVQAVVPDGDVPTIISLRLKVQNHLITEAEAIVAPKRIIDPKHMMDLWSSPEKLVRLSPYFTRRIPPAEQNSRYELIAAADAYFRAFETEGTPDYIRAPLLPDTQRFENGEQTTNVTFGTLLPQPATAAEQFDRAIFKGTVIADRRYLVVDAEIGAVQGLVRFGDPNWPPARVGDSTEPLGAAFVSEIFAVTQGKIVEIQAVFIFPKESIPTPWPVGVLPVRDH